jgi:hypothetical protein
MKKRSDARKHLGSAILHSLDKLKRIIEALAARNPIRQRGGSTQYVVISPIDKKYYFSY